MRLNTYLNFGGNREQAFRFYEQHLGGEITMPMRPSSQTSLSPGPAGQVFMAMEETFFAVRFAMLRDRFGTSWMVLALKPPTPCSFRVVPYVVPSDNSGQRRSHWRRDMWYPRRTITSPRPRFTSTRTSCQPSRGCGCG